MARSLSSLIQTIKKISSRKRFRVGVLLAGVTSVFLLYLMYEDIVAARDFRVSEKKVAAFRHRDGLQSYVDLNDNLAKITVADQWREHGGKEDLSRAEHGIPSEQRGVGEETLVEQFKNNRDNLKEQRGNGNIDAGYLTQNIEEQDILDQELILYADRPVVFPNKRVINEKKERVLFTNENNYPNGTSKSKGKVRDKSKVSSKARSSMIHRKIRLFRGEVPPPENLNHSPETPGEDRRYIVYYCDKGHWCGGWGDRQRGIVSLYLLARFTHRKFKIIMTTPCNLARFYAPHQTQWIPQPGELSTKSLRWINTFSNPNFKSTLEDGDFNVKYPERVIYVRTNLDFYFQLRRNPEYVSALGKWPGLRKKVARFRWAWQELMTPSLPLLVRLETILGTDILVRQEILKQSVLTPGSLTQGKTRHIGNVTLICAHVRMGKNPTIPEDEELGGFKVSDLPKLHNFMVSEDISGNANFFVATDSEYIRQQSKSFFGERLVDYGGKIMHIDRQRRGESVCEGFEVALLDQLILTVCDILVVSKSGFSLNAATVSNSTYPVYIMEEGAISILKL